ncbi:SorU family sulfite dehydrogenase c-type cytochrome subunit [Chelativorans sp. YIM 93263]|uniref:SorU family sulfite dehydrogenase c-type cytochrome subunit n=1 Tax=Chelativorans sp. YIM 93263 TaxID=2906648 RepID=UPI00237926EC|nr:cytochrome c [Chelativorans sp. YIM 93263]
MLKACRYAGVFVCLAVTIPLAGASEDNPSEEQIEMGREVFTSAEPACVVCHTLQDAEAAGRIGPNLDDLQPSEDQVRLVVRGGAGAMPAYEGLLSDEEIDAVAAYVAHAAGGE